MGARKHTLLIACGALVATLLVAGTATAAPIPGTNRPRTNIQVSGQWMTWDEAAYHVACTSPDGYYTDFQRHFVTNLATNVTRQLGSDTVNETPWTHDGGLAYADIYNVCDRSDKGESGVLDLASGAMTPFDSLPEFDAAAARHLGDNAHVYMSMVGGELISLPDDASSAAGTSNGVRIDLTTGRTRVTVVPKRTYSDQPAARAVNGDLVWVSAPCRNVVRWSYDTNEVSSSRPSVSGYDTSWSGREVPVSGCPLWLDADTGQLHRRLRVLDVYGTNRYFHGVIHWNRLVGTSTSVLGGDCCAEVLNTATGEISMVPPVRGHQIVLGMGAGRIVWEEKTFSGKTLGPMYQEKISALPKAVNLHSARRVGRNLRFRFSTFRTGSPAWVAVWKHGHWTTISKQTYNHSLTVTDRKGAQWYRIISGQYISRRVLR